MKNSCYKWKILEFTTKKKSPEVFAWKIANFGENRKLFSDEIENLKISQTRSTTRQTSKQIDPGVLTRASSGSKSVSYFYRMRSDSFDSFTFLILTLATRVHFLLDTSFLLKVSCLRQRLFNLMV